MEITRPLTPLGRWLAFGAIAVFALCFISEALRTYQRGYFAINYGPRRSATYTKRYTFGPPHAQRIAAGCLAVGAAILLWGSIVVAPGLRSTARRRAGVSVASGVLLASALVLWFPPWRLWPDSPWLLVYLLPGLVAFLWRVTRSNDVHAQELRRTRAGLILLAAVGFLAYRLGTDILGGTAAGLFVIALTIVHRRFAAPDGIPTRG